LAAALVAGSAALSPAQALVIGVADSANSIPFGGTTGGYTYQQVYNGASFSSSMTIQEISFYDTLYPGGTARPGVFDIYLSTTTAPIASFDTSNGTSVPYFDSSFTSVFHGTLPQLMSNSLDFNLSTFFDYDPSKGNLLLTIRSSDLLEGNNLFLDVDKNNGVMNSRFSAYPYDWNEGLVTGFNTSVASAVPEPSTWAMLMIGFAGIGLLARKKRRLMTLSV
jgi:PEP-CTERM motif-containing protein